MRGNQVRVNDRELAAILNHAVGATGAPSEITIVGEGVINDTRLLTWPDGTRRYLQVAPSDAVAAAGPGWFTPYGLRREAAVIAAAHTLADYLPVTVAHDFERTVIDRDWVIQDAMRGIPLSAIDRTLDKRDRDVIWTQLGDFVRKLNAVAGTWFGAPAFGVRHGTWSGLLQSDVAALIDDAERLGYDSGPFRRLAKAVLDLEPLLALVRRPALIHSDLARGHIFVEKDAAGWVLKGVIDLEFGRYADPLSEHLIVGFAYDNTPAEMQPAFERGYGEFHFDPRLRQLYVALDLAWFAPLLDMQGEPLDDLLARLSGVLDELDALERLA
jgi:aminoglycoside phosphotransferase (APT) family kinase protein